MGQAVLTGRLCLRTPCNVALDGLDFGGESSLEHGLRGRRCLRNATQCLHLNALCRRRLDDNFGVLEADVEM